jgi:hypothetical protein
LEVAVEKRIGSVRRLPPKPSKNKEHGNYGKVIKGSRFAFIPPTGCSNIVMRTSNHF